MFVGEKYSCDFTETGSKRINKIKNAACFLNFTLSRSDFSYVLDITMITSTKGVCYDRSPSGRLRRLYRGDVCQIWSFRYNSPAGESLNDRKKHPLHQTRNHKNCTSKNSTSGTHKKTQIVTLFFSLFSRVSRAFSTISNKNPGDRRSARFSGLAGSARPRKGCPAKADRKPEAKL